MIQCEPCKDAGILRTAHYQAGNGKPAMCYDCRNGKKKGSVAVAEKPQTNGHISPADAFAATKPQPPIAVENIDGMMKLLNTALAGVMEGSMLPSTSKSLCEIADKLIKAIELKHKLTLK